MIDGARQYKGKSLLAFPNNYTVVDIETNGFYSDVCEILEISAVRYRERRMTEVFSTLIKPARPVDYFITQLTGITNAMVANGANITDALDSFYTFVGDDIILGYNVNFDVNFLYDNLMRYRGKPLKNDFVDVLRLARRALPDLEDRKQTTVARHYGISVEGAHRAERDCIICNSCYERLRNEPVFATLRHDADVRGDKLF